MATITKGTKVKINKALGSYSASVTYTVTDVDTEYKEVRLSQGTKVLGWVKMDDVKTTSAIDSSKLKKGETVREFVKRTIPTVTDGERKKWLQIFDRCVLPENVDKAITDAIVTILRADMFEKWGINEHFEKGVTNSILLHGPPGTGKTMIAESIAAVLDKNIMTLSTKDFQSNVPGETERNIVKNFKLAEQNDAVIVLDECDSMLTNRDMVGAIMGSEINQLLTSLENFKGVCILTTNRIHRLDPALERRIIAKVELPRPTQEARLRIWTSSMPPKLPLAKDVDFERLAEIDLSGGQIKNAILLATRRAVAEWRNNVTMDDIASAVELESNAQKEFSSAKASKLNIVDKQVKA